MKNMFNASVVVLAFVTSVAAQAQIRPASARPDPARNVDEREWIADQRALFADGGDDVGKIAAVGRIGRRAARRA